MFALGPLSFAAPVALLGLLSLPALWLLLRATPPAPKRAIFPPLRLLAGAPDDAETPHHAPWWLIVFRLLLAALIIIALARPVWTPPAVEIDTQPALIVMDNGWASAPAWDAMSREANRLIDQAERDGRQTAIAFTAPTGEIASPVRLASADMTRQLLQSVSPLAWPANRGETAGRIETAREDGALADNLSITWLTSGLDSDDAEDLARSLSRMGPVTIIEPDAGRAAIGIAPPEANSDGLRIELRRAAQDLPRSVAVTAIGADGRAIARSQGEFGAGEAVVSLDMNLPLDLRNRIAMLRVEGSASAGSVRLLGDQWQRPRVGLLQRVSEDGQPLLSDLHYVENAIATFSQTTRGDIDELLEDTPAVLVMVDDARSEDERLGEFITEGGVLIRFAGPRLAARSDSFLPVRLREGGRLFGGSLNWDTPQNIAPFGLDSPFAGLPSDATALIDRQVLAEPGSARPDRVWARLEDGTPLVTAERRGRGWIVLFHVTASPDWSDLPLSGLFPRMLQRVLGLAQGGQMAGQSSGAWAISRALDASGQLTPAPTSARPVAATVWDSTTASYLAPAGLYSLGTATSALNVVTSQTSMTPLARDLPNTRFAGLDGPRATHFDAALLTLALIMLILDVVIALGLAGRLPQLGRGAATAAGLGLAILVWSPDSNAQDEPENVPNLQAALELRFAYVRTGNDSLDSRSRQGLTGLSQEIWRRSAMEPNDPLGINVEEDSLIFFPMIYWPITRDARALSEAAAARVNTYLQSGGLIIFDTQDADVALLRAGAPHPGLVSVLESIDVPPLARIPSDHVVTRSFYLLQEFPGRYSGQPVWVEANPDGASRDGTSGVLIGSHDWASAWAVGENGNSIAVVDGGERQRELAQRFGVNLAMYALTGNYKADQVHAADILERLGH
jgi:hypothetical protein